MPNLVGTGLNQVPTNSMLGGLAYQDPEHASIKDLDLKNLSQINSEIADTAVDVFVYDTRKDSDGGAWRKRTQHTSWYNETLGTATRGTRKEFPAVAVLVLQGTVFTIYDGDDPDLPMWMVFNKASNSYFSVTTNSCVTALNGKIVSGGNASNDRLRVIDFLLDNELEYSNPSTGQRTHLSPISGRNDTVGFTAYDSSLPGIVNRYINDVAMTVLPNAPIDDVTGLLVPTIALATDGGVSVIKDDGTVVSSAGDAAGLVEYLDNNYILITRDNSSGYFAVHNNHFTSGSWNASANSYYSATIPTFNQSGYINGIAASENGYFGNSIGVHIYDALSSSSTNTNGLFSNITTSYNTGWMVGDIKGAFLSDTVTEKDGVNYALSGVAGGSNRLSSLNYSSGDLSWQMVDNASSANGYLNINLAGLTVGQQYKISMTWDNNAALDSGYDHRIAHKNGTADENATNFDHWNKTNGSSETLIGVFTAQSVNDDDLVIYANAITLNISNFKIEETDDVFGFEKIANYNFAADFSTQWQVKNNAITSYDATNDRVTVTSTQNYSGIQLKSASLPPLVQGKRYIMTIDIHSINNPIRFGVVSGGTKDSVNSTGPHTLTFTAQASVTEVFVEKPTGSNSTFVLNSVSIREAEDDRSANNNGFQVFGTITKSAVATGAELVGYTPPSGTIGANYLSKPLSSSDFDLTGDWSITFWAKRNGQTADNYSGFEIAEDDVSANTAYGKIPFSIFIDNAGNTGWRGTNVTGYQINTLLATQDVWKCITTVNRSGKLYIYVDGEYVTSTPATFTNPSNPYSLGIFRFTYGSSRHDGRRHIDYALFRMSESSPSAEQIRKMYNDERHLFRENAKCTLYGSSDAVTALAYDDSTNLLYAGTSSGRSEFQGLRRINNTTTAVTTAISASNGLVAEQ